jgi:hypothetical protein
LKTTLKISFGGLLTALSVVVMLCGSFIPYLEITLAPIVSLIILFAVIETDDKTATVIYFLTSLISLIFISNKEPVILYAFFFGYYPIVKRKTESKFRFAVEMVIKFVVFNISIIIAYLILTFVFKIPFDLTQDFYQYAVLAFFVLFNIVFILYDFALTRVISAYMLVWQKGFHKIFKIK